MRVIKLLFCIISLVLAVNAAPAVPLAAKPSASCVRPAEVKLMQLTALQQELMDAALTCGADARTAYNRFQTAFGPALRQADGQLAAVFRRVSGKAGTAAHNRFKTDLAAGAELRRVQNAPGFCSAATEKAAGAFLIAPGKAAARGAALLHYASTQVAADPAWPFAPCAR